MHKMINFVESINNSFAPYFVPANSTTLRPNSTLKDVGPCNLSLCRSHLCSASIINATATTLNMMGKKVKTLARVKEADYISLSLTVVFYRVLLTQSLLGVAFAFQQQEWYLKPTFKYGL